MTDDNDTDGEREYVAVGQNAWGRGDTEAEALQNMVPNLPSRIASGDDPVRFALVEVFGFHNVDGVRGTVHADEIIEERKLESEPWRIKDLKEAIRQAELQADETLSAADERDW